jgi:hypothetical protein
VASYVQRRYVVAGKGGDTLDLVPRGIYVWETKTWIKKQLHACIRVLFDAVAGSYYQIRAGIELHHLLVSDSYNVWV